MIIALVDKNVADLVLPMVDTALVSKKEGLEEVWSLPGRWGGVAADAESGTVYAAQLQSLIQVDAEGKTKSTVPFASFGMAIVRVARFADDQLAFLSFGTWSANVQAFDSKGQRLWAYPPPDNAGQGIDDVWPIDLDGDRSDEVIVGFNGNTGLHVLDSKGNVIWKVTTGIGNVWHVSGGNVFGGGKPAVVSTSAKGDVHIFTENGTKRTDVNAGVYANMVRVGKVLDTDKADTIIAGASGTTNATLVALSSGDDLNATSTNPTNETDLLQRLQTLARQRLPEYGRTKWKLDLRRCRLLSFNPRILPPGSHGLESGCGEGLCMLWTRTVVSSLVRSTVRGRTRNSHGFP